MKKRDVMELVRYVGELKNWCERLYLEVARLNYEVDVLRGRRPSAEQGLPPDPPEMQTQREKRI